MGHLLGKSISETNNRPREARDKKEETESSDHQEYLSPPVSICSLLSLPFYHYSWPLKRATTITIKGVKERLPIICIHSRVKVDTRAIFLGG